MAAKSPWRADGTKSLAVVARRDVASGGRDKVLTTSDRLPSSIASIGASYLTNLTLLAGGVAQSFGQSCRAEELTTGGRGYRFVPLVR